MSVTNIHEAKTNLSKLIEAAERGEEVVIARNGKRVAAIVPISPPSVNDDEKNTPGKRIEGIWAGKVVVNDPDWWKNDDEFIDLFYDVSKFTKILMLLDSNVLVFWTLRSPLLPPGVSSAIRDAQNLAISIATIWELEIKRGIGKFGSAFDWDDLTTNHVQLLPIEIEDAVLAGSLPLYHRDPFDRMIIAQAMRRSLPIVTRDRMFGEYGVPVIWA